jgi:hypothetical protein
MAPLAQVVASQKVDATTFGKLTQPEVTAIKPELPPPPAQAFTPDQRYWHERWWIKVTSAQLAAINAALPENTRVEALSWGGLLYIGSDLLTDLDRTYGKARSPLEALPAAVPLEIDAIRVSRARATP